MDALSSVSGFQEVRCMEVRCGSCNKLFRIADEKISGSGIKFSCSKCRGTVKITREEFERYLQLKTAEPVLPPSAGKQPLKMEVRCGSCSKPFRISEDKIAGSGIKFACSKCGASVTISKEDLENYKRSLEKAGQVSTRAESPTGGDAEMFMPAPAAKPAAVSIPKPAPPKPQPSLPETKAPLPTQREQVKPPVKPGPEPAGIVRPAAPATASSPPATSSTLRQLLVLAAAVLIIVAVGYMATSHFKEPAPVAKEPDGTLMSIEGLQVVNTTAVHDARGDYVISGDIVNTTDVERPAWLLVAEVFDEKGVLLGRARMLNGIELYTSRDYELLAKRGTNIQELKARNLEEQRSKILPRGTVHFEITILEAPAGGVKFDANLQPFDPVQLFKEVIAEQKQP
jgi:hypothetical protein